MVISGKKKTGIRVFLTSLTKETNLNQTPMLKHSAGSTNALEAKETRRRKESKYVMIEGRTSGNSSLFVRGQHSSIVDACF